MAEQLDHTEWRDIPGFPGYQASSLGHVKSLSRRIWNSRGFYFTRPEHILKTPKPDRYGYLSYCLRSGASQDQPHKKTFLAHRLVALAFIPNPEDKPFINHKDGIKGNCRPSNLEWCTKSENGIHAVETGLHTALRGESNGNSIITEASVLELRAKYSTGRYTYKDLAVEYKIGRTTVSYIVKGKLWGYLPTIAQRDGFSDSHAAIKSEALSTALKGRQGKKGDDHPRAKLDTESVLSIRNKFKPRVYTVAMLASEYEISPATVKAILQRRLWAHV